MSVHYASYQRKCDGCGAIHPAQCSSPRRAMSAAKRDGWQRREIVVGQYEGIVWGHNTVGVYGPTDERKMYDERAWQDLCPKCLDALDESEAA